MEFSPVDFTKCAGYKVNIRIIKVPTQQQSIIRNHRKNFPMFIVGNNSNDKTTVKPRIDLKNNRKTWRNNTRLRNINTDLNKWRYIHECKGLG